MVESLGPWFALFVKPRHEKHVASMLAHKGYEQFLPLYQRRCSRTRCFELPMFPSYVFCRLDPHNRLPVLSVPGVFSIVGSGKTILPVDNQEIAAIQAIVGSGLAALPWPFLETGQSVRIDRGSLSGLEGILVKTKALHRLVVSVTLLQRSVAVEIDRGWVTPLRKAPQLAAAGATRLAAHR
jgi:transcription antitermination factor NusG